MYAQTLHEYQTKEIEQIGKLIAGGLASTDLIGPGSADRLFLYRRQARARLIDILVRTGSFGRTQVNAELKRQGA